MLLRVLALFTTLVALTTSGWAATPTPQPDLRRPTEPAHSSVNEGEDVPVDDNKPDAAILSTTDILSAPPPPARQDATLEPVFLFHQEVTPRLGIVVDLSKVTDPAFAPDMTYGFTWTLPQSGPSHFEVSVDAFPDNTGAPGFGWRYNFKAHQRFRPFVKAGIKTRFIPEEQMATLVNFNNYQVTISGGCEYQLIKHIAAHFELESGFGPRFHTLILFAGGAYTF